MLKTDYSETYEFIAVEIIDANWPMSETRSLRTTALPKFFANEKDVVDYFMTNNPNKYQIYKLTPVEISKDVKIK